MEVGVGNMATITATKNGAWSDDTVWDLDRQPADGDDVDLSSYVVSITDITVPIEGGSLKSLTASTGSLQIVNTENIINCDDIYAGANDPLINLGFTQELIINGNIHGSTTTQGASCITCGTNSVLTINGHIYGGEQINANGLEIQTAQTVIINGNSTGGTTSSSHGIVYASTGGNVVINGSLFGGDIGYGLSVAGTNTNVTINGSINGGGTENNAAYGLYNNTTSSTIICNGDIIGGNNRNAYGIYNNSTGNITVTTGIEFTLAPPFAGTVTFNANERSQLRIDEDIFRLSREIIGGAIIGGLGEWCF
jgi:hypothetical protein